MDEGKKAAVNILGVRVHAVTMNDTISIVDEYVKSKGCHYLSFVNPEIIMLARKRKFVSLLNSFSLNAPDGVGLLMAARILGSRLPERVTGTDVMDRIAELADDRRYSIYLLGGKPGVAEEAANKLKEKYPALMIAGVMHGYYAEAEEGEVLHRIRAAKPDILIVCLGMYKQEMWLSKHGDTLNVPVSFGNGGALDFTAERARRAPKWMLRFGLEWLYRLIREPRRWRRQLALPQFVLLVFSQRARELYVRFRAHCLAST